MAKGYSMVTTLKRVCGICLTRQFAVFEDFGCSEGREAVGVKSGIYDWHV